MRKHLYLITEHEDSDKVGLLKTTDTRLTGAKKNEERVIQTLDREAIERGEITDDDRGEYKVVGLGYHDFEDGDDYEETIGNVVQEKLSEIDTEHLEKAGHDPEEVLA